MAATGDVTRLARGRAGTRLTDAEAAVLGLLALGEASGYDLNRCAKDSVDLILAPTKSRIYAVLPRLSARGYITRRDVEQLDRPDKQLYRLLPEGQAAFKSWLNDVSTPLTRDQLLLKVFFGNKADPAALAAQVEAFRASKQEELELLRGIEPDDPFRGLTVAFGIALARTAVGWAEEAADLLNKTQHRLR